MRTEKRVGNHFPDDRALSPEPLPVPTTPPNPDSLSTTQTPPTPPTPPTTPPNQDPWYKSKLIIIVGGAIM